MLKYEDSSEVKGASTCPIGEVTPSGDARPVWCSERNNGNNAWIVNPNNGNVNNNNTYNRYFCAGAVELADDEVQRLLDAEDECYKNKHSSSDAARVHYNLREVYRLAKSVHDGIWEQGRAIVFAITYPTPREVWAAFYTDRILHHYVASFMTDVAEKIHKRNGDVSHGNRKEHSALTAAIQINGYMRMMPYGVVATRDISGYFMSINRRMAADKMLSESYGCEQAVILEKLILHNPTSNCEVRSSKRMMGTIPQNKSLFYANDGCGLPIGNYYSQAVANVFLDEVDRLHLTDKWRGRILYARFVDDMCVVGPDAATVNAFFRDVEAIIISLGLRLNARKKYMQPVLHGVTFCGYTIHSHGIYINNRTAKACERRVGTSADAESLVRSLNSYFGFFVHCKAFNIQRRIAMMAKMKFSDSIVIEKRKSQIVFSIPFEKTYKFVSLKQLTTFKTSYHDIGKIHQRGNAPRRNRGREADRASYNRRLRTRLSYRQTMRGCHSAL